MTFPLKAKPTTGLWSNRECDLVVQADFKDLTVLGEPQLSIDSFSFDAAWTIHGEASKLWIDNATRSSQALIFWKFQNTVDWFEAELASLTEKWNISDAVNVLTGSGLLSGKANSFILKTLNPRGSIDSFSSLLTLGGRRSPHGMRRWPSPTQRLIPIIKYRVWLALMRQSQLTTLAPSRG